MDWLPHERRKQRLLDDGEKRLAQLLDTLAAPVEVLLGWAVVADRHHHLPSAAFSRCTSELLPAPDGPKQ